MNKKTTTLLTIVALFVTGNLMSQITNGLITHYSFDGSANDLIGSVHGTVHGATADTGRGGIQNTAYYFDGINDYIDFGSTDPINDTSDVTGCVWFKPFDPVVPSDTINPDGNQNQYLFNTGGQTQSIGYAVLWSKGSVRAVRRTNSQWATVDHVGYADNNWHHVCFVYNNAANNIRVYLDAAAIADSNGINSSYTNSSPEVYAGKATTPSHLSPPFHFHGLIDDIKLYKRVLTANEIDSLFEYTPIPTGVETKKDEKSMSIELYPNPTNGGLFVNYSFESPVILPAIRIVDIQGKVVHEERLNESIHQSSLRLDLDLAAGNYILQFTSNGNIIKSEKIIVQ